MTRLADPERELALHYAPRDARPLLRALWALDERLGAIVADTSEPAIGEMRLLWWREALEKLADSVPAEPLLNDIARLLGGRVSGAAAWGGIAEGWYALLQPSLDADDLARFARERGGRLFAESANVLGASFDGLESAGAAWALADLAAHSSSEELAAAAREVAGNIAGEAGPARWPVALRPLGALTAIARRDLRRGVAGRPGSPSRVARMAWHRITGR